MFQLSKQPQVRSGKWPEKHLPKKPSIFGIDALSLMYVICYKRSKSI